MVRRKNASTGAVLLLGGSVIEWEQFRPLRPTSGRKGECFLELRYTMTKADLRRQFLALGRTKGSLARRQMRTGRLLTAAVVLFAEALYAVSLLTREPVVSNATWLALGVLALLLVPLLAIFWVLEPRQFAARQMRELRAVLPAMTTQPYTLQLEAGLLRYSGPGAAGGHGQAECPAADLRAVRADRDGLVVVLGDGSGLLVPRAAFAGPEGPEDWVRALLAAPARPDAAPPADRMPDGFVAEGAGGTFACTLTAEELPRLLWEASRAAMRTPAYWRQKWYALPVLALAFAVFCLAMGLWLALALTAVLVLVSLWATRRLVRQQIPRMAGRAVTRFGPDTMQYTDDRGRMLEIPYADFPLLLQTAHSLALYAPKANALRLFPRRVLTAESEAALLALLRDRLSRRPA